MNAGPDVERSIAHWLAEESPGRAPDRILANAGSVIDRTKQRRFAVAWREPVTISLRGLALVAGLVIVAVVGAGFVGRSTASVGGQPSPSPIASVAPSAHVATLAEYKAARDAICTAAWTDRATYDARIGTGLTDPALPATERATKLQAFQEFLTWAKNLTGRLHALDVPPSMAADEQAAYTSSVASGRILDQEVALIQQGKYSEADAVDQTTNATSSIAESFEAKYGLSPCP